MVVREESVWILQRDASASASASAEYSQRRPGTNRDRVW